MSKDASISKTADEAVDSRGLRIRLLLCAMVSLALYWVLANVSVILFASRPTFASEVFPWVAKIDADTIQTMRDQVHAIHPNVSFAILCAALFAVYAVALRLVKNCDSFAVQRLVFITGSLFVLWFMVTPVMLSTDIFAYGYYGRVISRYGGSAYVENPQLSQDRFYQLFNGQCPVSMYGPLWNLISAGITRVGGDHIGLTVLLFRMLSALSIMAAGGLIWKCLRVFSPQHATTGLVMFLWNPLVVLESGLSGHNDSTMVALALLAVWLHQKGWKSGAVVALTLSALIKFITGMLVPLYMLMVLRNLKTWRERILFTLCSVVAAALVIAAVLPLVNVKVSLNREKKSDAPPAGAQATSPAFYANNFHELIFKGIRRLMGEDSVSVNVPINTFGSYWITATEDTALRDTEDENGPVLTPIKKGQNMIAIAPQMSDWARVYDPASHKRGYIFGDSTTWIEDPAVVPDDPELTLLQMDDVERPTVLKANKILRAVTWGLFALFGLLAAWKTTDFDKFLLWSAAALLASYFLVMTQMWPWYVIWALAFAALKPGNLPARLSVILSGFLLTLYITLSFASSPPYEWVDIYRSIPAMVLPMVVFLATIPFWRKPRTQGIMTGASSGYGV